MVHVELMGALRMLYTRTKAHSNYIELPRAAATTRALVNIAEDLALSG
jgi:hypothetical protein